MPQGQKKAYAELLVDRWINEALVKGDFNALKEIVRYVDGMPKQTVENLNKNIDNVLNQLENKPLDEEIND